MDAAPPLPRGQQRPAFALPTSEEAPGGGEAVVLAAPTDEPPLILTKSFSPHFDAKKD